MEMKINKEKFECDKCGCFYWVEDRNNFNCPNCEDKKEVLKCSKEDKEALFLAVHNLEEFKIISDSEALTLEQEILLKYGEIKE